jgi:uncharacterized coiled-coil protein SlyX
MKTAMQELIDEMTYMLTEGERSIYALREKARKLLEKEKEVMESAWQDGMYECDGDGTFEDFYKTFNTKEK